MLTSDTITVEGVSSDVESRRCARRGCRSPAAEDSERCARCDEKQRRYQRDYMARKRQEWDAAELCTRCGGNRAPRSKWCTGCLIATGRVHLEDRKSHVESRRDRIRARIVRGVDGRRRYHGQGKRGAPSVDQVDSVDLRHARRDFDHGVEGLAYFRSETVALMPRLQREDVKQAAVAKLVETARRLLDVAKRHGHEEIETAPEEDEAMPVRGGARAKMGGR